MDNELNKLYSNYAQYGSSYVRLFHEYADRNDLYEIVKDFIYGNDYIHFLKKYVDEQDPSAPQINYKILFTPTAYTLRYLINEYLDHVKVLKHLKGLKTPLNDQEKAKLAKFFELNNWNDLFKSIVRNRRLIGDDYLHIRTKTLPEFGKMPILKRLEAEDMEIVRNPYDPLEKEYLYKAQTETVIRSKDNPMETATLTTDIQLLFTKGKTIPYKGNTIEENSVVYLPQGFEEYLPIIHFQYLKAENSDYSEIPALDFIDSILRLHRIETDIAETNSKSGSPQIWIKDGDVDKKSRFGARGIGYVDTTQQALNKGGSAEIISIEITNGLDSLYKEQESVLNAMFTGANLIPPAMKMLLAKSDSSKVIKYLSTDLVEELRLAYEEISEKTKIIWKLLFPHRQDEDISLEVPLDLYNSSLYDKATYINSNVLTLRQMYREQGKTEEEINEIMSEIAEQIQLLKGNGLSNIVPQIDTAYESITTKEKSDVEGLPSDVARLYNPKAGK